MRLSRFVRSFDKISVAKSSYCAKNINAQIPLQWEQGKATCLNQAILEV